MAGGADPPGEFGGAVGSGADAGGDDRDVCRARVRLPSTAVPWPAVSYGTGRRPDVVVRPVRSGAPFVPAPRIYDSDCSNNVYDTQL